MAATDLVSRSFPLNVTKKGQRWLSSLGASVAAAAEKSAKPSTKPGWTRVVIPIETVDYSAGERTAPVCFTKLRRSR